LATTKNLQKSKAPVQESSSSQNRQPKVSDRASMSRNIAKQYDKGKLGGLTPIKRFRSNQKTPMKMQRQQRLVEDESIDIS